MRLFLIDKPECRHISDIMPGIKAVYQMEQEFSPYLTVDFLPNNNNDPGGVIIQVGDEVIRKYYTFEDSDDIKKLREDLWILVRKYHNPIDITNKEGCIKDFRQTPTFNVVQGWQNAKRSKADVCCKVIIEMISDEFADYMIKHWVYRDPTEDIQNRDICKQIRSKECGDNYAPNSPQFRRCIREVNWLCNNGYPEDNNKRVNNVNKMVKDLRIKIYNYLDKNDMKVDKRTFDNIITAGLFDYVGNRMGNKSRNMYDVKNTIRDSLYEKNIYLKLIEDFNSENINSNISIVKMLSIIFIIILVIYMYNGYFRRYF